MQSVWQQRLRPFALVMASALILLSTFRFALALWQFPRFESESQFLWLMLQGVRVDIATLSYLFLLPVFVHLLLPVNVISSRIWQHVIVVLCTTAVGFLVYMELVTPTFIAEYDLRPNRLFVEYLIYPKEVFAMLWAGYKVAIFSVLALFTLTVIFAYKRITKLFANAQLMSSKNAARKSVLQLSLAAFLVVLLAFIGGRSSLGHRPLNPAMVAFSNDVLLNDLALNSSYSLAFAIKNMRSEKSASDFYGKMPVEQMLSLVKQAAPNYVQFIEHANPTQNTREATYQGKPKNLVVLLQESLGARFVGAMGGLALTPNLDRLLQQGWRFDNMFATGTRSVRGIEAMTTGFLPTPSRAVVKLSKAQHNFYTLADTLSEKGYHTQFIYGGEAHFDNMKSFLLGNGFNDIVDLPRFEKTTFVGSWGACDQDLYQEAHRQFEQLAAQDKPFFSLVFTSSNHTPYEYPDNVSEQYDSEKNTRNNAIKYSDHALGEFFAKARNASYWENTVFVVIADHDARVDSRQLVPVKNFHIPALILGEGISAKTDLRIASNLDMPPTLLSLIGVDATSPMLGNDLTRPLSEANERAMMQFGNNFGYLTRDNLVVLTPNQDAKQFSYHGFDAPLVPTTTNNMLADTAKAHALLGNYLYQKGLYQYQ